MAESKMTEERRKRLLTDEDVEALAGAFEQRMLKSLYLNVGKGFVGVIWKAVLIILIVLAAYGAGIKGFKF